MNKLIIGVNDLATMNPDLAEEWDYEVNGKLTPNNVLSNSRKKVGWKIIVNHPITKEPIVLKWFATVNDRNHGNGCPYLNGQSVFKGFNDLETLNPELCKQWDYEANKGLKDNRGKDVSTPDKVSCGSTIKVNWIFHYDDSFTGRHFDFKWQATVAEQVKHGICPFLTGQRVWVGYNDLKTTNPHLATEWDYEGNKGLVDKKGRDISTPDKVTSKSGQNVNWILPYYDSKTGKYFIFKWNANIKHRANGARCPFLCGTAVWKGFNDFETLYPELAKEWDYEANKGLTDGKGKDISTPDKITANSTHKVNWILKHKDDKSGELLVFRWKARPSDRVRGTGCPQLTSSRGEKSIGQILKLQNIKFKEQYTFKDRFYISKKAPLKDDFAIFDKNGNVVGTIEYHGEQHYMPIDFAGKGKDWAEKQFKQIQDRDKIKSDFLKDHNIPQLIIPYWDFHKIGDLVPQFIQTLQIKYNI